MVIKSLSLRKLGDMDNREVESTASVPFGEDHLAKFKDLFPGIFNDGILDARQLGELLNVQVSGVADQKESFGLRWAGQARAIESLHLESLAALRPDKANSADWDTASNVFVEGDNLEVLKLLRKAYNDQVRLIYIDPPYNTGNDFVYNDDFSDPKQHFLEVTGQVDAEGNKLVANTDVSGRKHSNWLTMMFPRLAIARELLTQDGAIFVSIDDNEVHNLRALMDDLYGPENFIGQFVWAAGRKNDSKLVSTSHEYMVVYARNVNALVESAGSWRTRKEGLGEIYTAFDKIKKKHGTNLSGATREMKAWFKSLPDSNPAKRHKQYCMVDDRGLYFADNISWPGSGGPYFEVIHPDTGKPVKLPKTGWRFTEDKLQSLIDDNRVHFGVDESTVPCIKRYLTDSEEEVPYSVFYKDGRGATKRLREFLGGDYFDFPKDETVIQSIVEFATDKDSLVMDFFAGSGTTAHAVALQNQLDGGNRRHLLVTLDEKTNEKSAAAKAGIETVSEITRMRLQKVLEAFPEEATRGLRCFCLGSPSFKRFVENQDALEIFKFTLEDDAEDDAIAAEILLHLGVRLDQPWSRMTVGGQPAIESGHVLVVLAREISDAVVDEAFASDAKTIAFLEDGFATQDKVKAKAFFAAEQTSKTMSTF